MNKNIFIIFLLIILLNINITLYFILFIRINSRIKRIITKNKERIAASKISRYAARLADNRWTSWVTEWYPRERKRPLDRSTGRWHAYVEEMGRDWTNSSG